MADTAAAPDVDVDIDIDIDIDASAVATAAEQAAGELATTLPSGQISVDASSSSTDAAAKLLLPPSIPAPTRAPIGAALAAVPVNTDAFLGHLMRCLQTRSGADVVLQFLCYSSRLSGSVLETLSQPALSQSARKLLALVVSLPPAAAVALSSTPTPSPWAALALRLSARLGALSTLLSEARTINRLWGLLSFYFAFKGLVGRIRASSSKAGSEKASSESVVEARLAAVYAFAQLSIIIAYQVLENAAFLGSKKVLDLKPATLGKLAILSVRCWGTYVFMELGKLLLERARKVSSGEAVKDQAWATTWSKSFFRTFAWAPLTVHWSIPTGGPLPNIVVSLLAMYPSTGQMVDLWRDTA